MTETTIAVFGVPRPRVLDPTITGALTTMAPTEVAPVTRLSSAPRPAAPGVARIKPNSGPSPAATYALEGPAPRYLGSGELAHALAVRLDEVVSAALATRRPAVVTHVVITWSDEGHPPKRRVELIRVRAVGPGKNSLLGWAAELEVASKAPHFEIPPGASPANAFCVLFPWLSFCQPH